MARTTTFRSGFVNFVSMKNTEASVAMVAGDFVKLDTTGKGVLLATDNSRLYGVAHENIAAAATGVIEAIVCAIYQVKAAAGANLALSDPVSIASKTTVDGGGGGAKVVGVVVGYDPASAGYMDAQLIGEALVQAD